MIPRQVGRIYSFDEIGDVGEIIVEVSGMDTFKKWVWDGIKNYIYILINNKLQFSAEYSFI